MTESKERIIAECCMGEGGPRCLRHAHAEAKARQGAITLGDVAGLLQRRRELVGGAKKGPVYGPKRRPGRPKTKPEQPADAPPEPPAPERRGRPPKPAPALTEEERANREAIIEEAYNNYVNMGSVAKTLESAKLKDPKITRKDVQEWQDRNFVPLK